MVNDIETMGLRPVVLSARRRLVDAPDTVCTERARLATEAYRMYEGLPLSICRARTFAYITENMTLDVESNPVFAGNTSTKPRACHLNPEYGFTFSRQVMIENDGLEHILDGEIPGDILDFWCDRSIGGNSGPGHIAVDIGRVVSRGVRFIIEECREHLDQGSEAERTYRRAMIICLEGLIRWANRYADAAEAVAETAEDAALRKIHRRVAEACRRVPELPARSLFEGLQAIILCHLGLVMEGQGVSLSIGLPDRALAGFADEAKSDPEAAADLCAAFMLKIASNSLWGRGSKTQAVTVGGGGMDGADCSNALSLAFLEGANIARVGDPHLFLRWHDRLDPVLKRRAAELLANGLSYPLLIHDKPMIRGLTAAGIDTEHAAQYCIIGCNEIGIPGLSAETGIPWSGTINCARTITEILLESPDSISSMDDLLEQTVRRLRKQLTEARKSRHWTLEHRELRDPLPLTSALVRDCPVSGRDWAGGMRYQIPGLYERGITNAANGLAAVDELVFQKKECSIAELSQHLRSNHADECLLAELRAAPKWGNDDERVDRWAVRLVEMREKLLDEIDDRFGDPAHVVCHVVRSLHHVDGMRIGASADGRHSGEPIAASIGAMRGTEQSGPTAILNSVLKLDAGRYYRGAYNLNLTLPADRTKPETVLQLIEGFFGRGGQELQINCLDASVLRDAQQSPENYSTLVVRVAGLSSRFVDLSRYEQDELIARAETAG